MRGKFFALACCCLFTALTSINSFSASLQSPLDVQVIADEADAALAILAKKNAGQSIEESDWQRLLSSEGYLRLKKRKASFNRAFTDDEFKMFILSDDLARRAKLLEATLAKWTQSDPKATANRALAYLPKGAQIRAKIYPVIKPRDNSFVFELKTDPAIFLYLNPEMTKEQFENTLTHELHHVGYRDACASNLESPANLPPNVKPIVDWTGSFGEGVAMLAAAGGPSIHPHAASKPEERERWDRDVANINGELKKVEKFFLDILESGS